MDLFNYLLRQRIIFLAGYINDKVRLRAIGRKHSPCVLCLGVRVLCRVSLHQLSSLSDPVTQPCLALQMATQIVGSLLALEALDENADIRIYINSTGASQGLALFIYISPVFAV
jgi:ATP-dependent protease ClpP protease subunit